LFLKRFNHLALRVILIYILYSFINDVAILILMRQGISVLYLLASFTVIEYTLFALFFYLLSTSKKFNRFLLILSVLFYLLAIVNFVFLGAYENFDSLPASVEAFIIIIYCIYYFYDQLNKPQVTFIYSTFHFWITIGIFIYVAGTFFLFVQYSILSESQRTFFWIITLISNILKNILFTISFIIPSKPSDSNKKLEKPYDKILEVS